MDEVLTTTRVQLLLAQLQASVARPECRSCDCFVGLLTQLELDCQQDISALTAPLKGEPGTIHGCLGCEPCPPGALFAAYLQHGPRCSGEGCGCK